MHSKGTGSNDVIVIFAHCIEIIKAQLSENNIAIFKAAFSFDVLKHKLT